MEIIGFEKNSFIDYPQKIASVVFTPGCNMNCWYCHNREIILEKKGSIEQDDVFNFLYERKNFLDGLVITGGEPTLQKDLIEFIEKVKQMGMLVKLDTNGTDSEKLKKLFNLKLLDFVAMDIKAPFDKYGLITIINENQIQNIKDSINLIKNSGVLYEFRLTFAPNLSKYEVVDAIKQLGRIDRFALQFYKKPESVFEEKLQNHTRDEFEYVKNNTNNVKNFIIRGI